MNYIRKSYAISSSELSKQERYFMRIYFATADSKTKIVFKLHHPYQNSNLYIDTSTNIIYPLEKQHLMHKINEFFFVSQFFEYCINMH
jgi:hypothetical protein